MVIIAVLYVVLVWLIFSRFKLLKWNWSTGVATIVAGLLIIAAFDALLNTLTPVGRVSVSGRVIEVTPNVAGQVVEIPVKPNTLVASGTVLFKIDPTPFEYKVRELKAKLAESQSGAEQLKAGADGAAADVKAISSQVSFAEQRLSDIDKLARANTTSQFNLQDAQKQFDTLSAQLLSAQARETNARLALASQINGVNTAVAVVQAQLANAEWELDQTTIRAPTEGYVSFMALTAGDRAVPLKSAVAFIVLRDIQIVGIFPQVGFQTIKPGASVQFALADHPSRMYQSTVGAIVRGVGEGQISASGSLARVTSLPMTTEYPIQINLPPDLDPKTLRLGTAGTATVFSESAGPIGFFGSMLLWARAFALYL